MAVYSMHYFKGCLSAYADSDEVAELLRSLDNYAAQEAAAHIEGLWALAGQMMKHIEENT